jgi:hypothetical protein
VGLDGNHGPDHWLFVADMNGRILRVNIAQARPMFDVFSPARRATQTAIDYWRP